MKKIGTIVIISLAVTALTIGLSVCKKPEPAAEQVGKEIDKVVEKTGQEINKVVDKAGQEVEKAGKKIRETAKAPTK